MPVPRANAIGEGDAAVVAQRALHGRRSRAVRLGAHDRLAAHERQCHASDRRRADAARGEAVGRGAARVAHSVVRGGRGRRHARGHCAHAR